MIRKDQRPELQIADFRWRGDHGIGRFAREVRRGLSCLSELPIAGSPASPLDPLRTGAWLSYARPALYFTPGYNAPIWEPCPLVLTIHDLAHLVRPEHASSTKRAYYDYVVKRGARRAVTVVTVSEYSRQAICEWSGVSEDRVVNVGNGISEAFIAVGLPRRRSARPYFLYVGNHRPHKNFDGLLSAFRASGLQSDFELVSTGEPSSALRLQVAALGLEHSVRFVGTVTDSALAELYRAAVGLVFVSFYEGFGFPLVEAMACGTPVIASNVTSIPEVAGDAAILVNPREIDQIADAMRRLAENEEWQKLLSAKGLERAKAYTWQKTVENVGSILSSAKKK